MDTMTVGRLDTGTRVRIVDGWLEAGRTGRVVGVEVFVGQWWCPVLWDDADDPDFNKSAALEPLGELTSADWRDIMYALTLKARYVQDIDGKSADERRRHILEILGKISAPPRELDPEDWREIRLSLESELAGTASTNTETRFRIRSLMGKVGPECRDEAWVAVPPRGVDLTDLLARLYSDAPGAVARLCDEELDRSGTLLEGVRKLARKLADGGSGS